MLERYANGNGSLDWTIANWSCMEMNGVRGAEFMEDTYSQQSQSTYKCFWELVLTVAEISRWI